MGFGFGFKHSSWRFWVGERLKKIGALKGFRV